MLGWLQNNYNTLRDIVSNGYYKLKNYWTTLFSIVEQLYGSFSAIQLWGLRNLLPNIFYLAGNQYQSIVNLVTTYYYNLTALAGNFYRTLLVYIIDYFSRVGVICWNLYSNVVYLAADAYGVILNVVVYNGNNLLNLIYSINSIVLTITTPLFNELRFLLEKSIGSVVNLLSNQTSSLLNYLLNNFNKLRDFLEVGLAAMTNMVNNLSSQLIYIVQNQIPSILSLVNNIPNLLNFVNLYANNLAWLFSASVLSKLNFLMNLDISSLKETTDSIYTKIENKLIDKFFDIVEKAIERYW